MVSVTRLFSGRRACATLLALVMSASALAPLPAAHAAARKGKTTSVVQRGVIVVPVALQKKSSRLYTAVFVFSRTTGTPRGTLTSRGLATSTHRGYLVQTNRKVVTAAKLKSIDTEIGSMVAAGQRFSTVEKRLKVKVGELARIRGATAVAALNDKQLAKIFGSPSIRAGRVAQLSDKSGDIIGGAGGAGAIATAIGTAELGQLPLTAIVGGVTAVQGAAVGGAVTAAGVGGVLVGLGFNAVADGITNFVTDGESQDLGALVYDLTHPDTGYDLGTALYDALHPDEDQPAPATTPPASSDPAPPADTGTTTTPGSGDTTTSGSDDTTSGDSSSTTTSGSDETEQSEETGCDSSTQSCDSSDTGDSGDTGSGGETSPTTGGDSLPPDMDAGTSTGTLMLYLATNLAGNQAKRTFGAIDIAAGGKYGVDRQRLNEQAFLAFDELIGGFHLKQLQRGLNGRRDRYGLREPAGYVTSIDPTRIANFGLIEPQIDTLQLAR